MVFINRHNQRDVNKFYHKKFGGGGLGSFFKSVGSNIKSGLKTVTHAVKTSGKDLAMKAKGHVGDIAKEVLKKGIETAKDVGKQALAQGLQGAQQIVAEHGANLINDIASGKNIGDAFKDSAKNIGTSGKQLLKDIVQDTKENAKQGLRDTAIHGVRHTLGKVGIELPPLPSESAQADASPYTEDVLDEAMGGTGMTTKKKKRKTKKTVSIDKLLKTAEKHHKAKGGSVYV
jgi:hypothetical protein